MPYIKSLSGTKWFYRLEGSGEPLVFIHGWAGDSSFWLKQIEFFKQKFSTIAPDLPGHGRSQWQETDLKKMVEDLNYILKKRNIKKATIIGSSFGGLVALKFIDMHSEKVKRLILVGANAKFSKSKDHKFCLSRRQMKDLYDTLDKRFPGILEIFFRSLFTNEERKESTFLSTWSLIKNREILPKKEALKDMLEMIEKEDLRESLKKINSPSLIINGKNDYIASPSAGRYIQKQIRKARLEFLDNCGHVPFMTQPNIFNRIISDFIENRL